MDTKKLKQLSEFLVDWSMAWVEAVMDNSMEAEEKQEIKARCAQAQADFDEELNLIEQELIRKETVKE